MSEPDCFIDHDPGRYYSVQQFGERQTQNVALDNSNPFQPPSFDRALDLVVQVFAVRDDPARQCRDRRSIRHLVRREKVHHAVNGRFVLDFPGVEELQRARARFRFSSESWHR